MRPSGGDLEPLARATIGGETILYGPLGTVRSRCYRGAAGMVNIMTAPFSFPTAPDIGRITGGRLVRETTLTTGDLIWPLFVVEGEGRRESVASMPGVERVSVDGVVRAAEAA